MMSKRVRQKNKKQIFFIELSPRRKSLKIITSKLFKKTSTVVDLNGSIRENDY